MPVNRLPDKQPLALPRIQRLPVWRTWEQLEDDDIAEETPVALHYNGEPHVVMMLTPGDLEDFALGFSLTEEIVRELGEIRDVHIEALPEQRGYSIDVRIPAGRAAALSGHQRNLQGRSACGVCGTQEIETVLRPCRHVRAGSPVARAAISRALHALEERQPLNALTGAVHAAAWADGQGCLQAVREDVGRHNALDKLIGHMARQGLSCAQGFALITSRASYEMVQKAAVAGMPVLVAISAPTALAVRMAEDAGITLVGFARAKRQVVYSCPGRLRSDTPEAAAV